MTPAERHDPRALRLEVGPEPRAARARPERGGAEGREAGGELEGGGRRGWEEKRTGKKEADGELSYVGVPLEDGGQ